MFLRLKAMLIKEFIQVFRDPRMRIMLFLPPLMQLIIFGYAANTDIRNISLAVYDQDRSPESREMIERSPGLAERVFECMTGFLDGSVELVSQYIQDDFLVVMPIAFHRAADDFAGAHVEFFRLGGDGLFLRRSDEYRHAFCLHGVLPLELVFTYA